jgi:flavin-binding protein dodecin
LFIKIDIYGSQMPQVELACLIPDVRQLQMDGFKLHRWLASAGVEADYLGIVILRATVRRSAKVTRGGFMVGQPGSADTVYKVVEVIGTSAKSWEDAAKNAVETAAKTLRDLRIAEIVKIDMHIEDGKVLSYRTRVQLSFKYES